MHYLGRMYEFSAVLTVSAFLHKCMQEDCIYIGLYRDIAYISYTGSDRLNSKGRVIFLILSIAFIL